MKQQKATVTGYVDPKKVLKAAQSTKKKVELWPYVPYNLVANPYVAQAYDKKAPPNHVRAVPATAIIDQTTVDDHYTTMFSEENPNACYIM
ncbi:Heavy metal-associated isoprenylated plant protein 24 [Linum perenne]